MGKKKRQLPDPVFLRASEVLAMTGFRNQATLDAMSKDGSFPPKISLGKRAVGWRAEDVRAWIASRPEA